MGKSLLESVFGMAFGVLLTLLMAKVALSIAGMYGLVFIVSLGFAKVVGYLFIVRLATYQLNMGDVILGLKMGETGESPSKLAWTSRFVMLIVLLMLWFSAWVMTFFV